VSGGAPLSSETAAVNQTLIRLGEGGTGALTQQIRARQATARASLSDVRVNQHDMHSQSQAQFISLPDADHRNSCDFFVPPLHLI